MTLSCYSVLRTTNFTQNSWASDSSQYITGMSEGLKIWGVSSNVTPPPFLIELELELTDLPKNWEGGIHPLLSPGSDTPDYILRELSSTATAELK